MNLTSWVCPLNTPEQERSNSSSSSSSASWIQIVLSLLQVAKYLQSLLQATALTSFSCPSTVATFSKSSSVLTQMLVVPSKLAPARISLSFATFVSGLHATLRIVLLWLPSRVSLTSNLPSSFFDQSLMVLSELQLANRMLSGENSSAHTLLEWLVRVCCRVKLFGKS